MVIIGAGRLARALVKTLGDRVVAVIRRTPGAIDDEPAAAGAQICERLDEISTSFDCVWIATSDRSIPDVAGELASTRESWQGIVVIHSSGATPLAALEPFRVRAATTLAIHPNWGATGEQKIPEGIYWGVSSADQSGESAAAEILTLVAGRAIIVDEARRGVYHAAASTASNFSVTLYVMSLALYDAAGIDMDIAEDMAFSFMLDSIERIVPGNPIGALTGPIVRGDRDVVRLQIQGIREHAPELFETFQALVRLTTSLVDAGRG